MTLELFLIHRLFFACILLLFGIGLTFGVIPRNLRSTVFDTSRRVMGAAIMTLPLVTIVSYFCKLAYWGRDWCNVAHLSGFYVVTILVSISFVSLLGDPVAIRSRRFIGSILSCVLFPIPFSLTILYGDQTLIKIMTLASSLFLLATIIRECVSFYLLYQKALNRANNYYSDDMEVKIHWMQNSALFILSIAFICGISVFFEISYAWGLAISFYRCFVFIYIFFSFVKFINDYQNADVDVSVIVDSPVMGLSHADAALTNVADEEIVNNQDISSRLEAWVEKLGYTQRGITIQIVARDISTNRTYLSNYINTTYECSFKTWITRMRITQSQRMLIHNTDLSVSDIASTVGFSSLTSFSHAFKQVTGVSPMRWRQQSGCS